MVLNKIIKYNGFGWLQLAVFFCVFYFINRNDGRTVEVWDKGEISLSLIEGFGIVYCLISAAIYFYFSRSKQPLFSLPFFLHGIFSVLAFLLSLQWLYQVFQAINIYIPSLYNPITATNITLGLFLLGQLCFLINIIYGMNNGNLDQENQNGDILDM